MTSLEVRALAQYFLVSSVLLFLARLGVGLAVWREAFIEAFENAGLLVLLNALIFGLVYFLRRYSRRAD